VLGIVILILLNLAIGYVLALYQYRPDLLPFDWLKPGAAAAMVGMLSSPSEAGAVSIPSALNPHLEQATYDAIESAGTTRQIESALAEAQPTQPIADVDPRHGESVAALAPPLAAELPTSRSAAPADPESIVADSPNVAFIEDPSLEDQFRAEQAAARDVLTAFQSDLNEYQSQITALDDQVRNHASNDDPLAVQNYIQRFDQISDHYLQRQQSHLSSVDEQAKSLEAQPDPIQPCRTAAFEHAAAIDATRDNLAAAAMLADAAAACKAFLLATHRVADSSRALDTQLTQTIDRVANNTPNADRVQRRPATSASDAGKTPQIPPANLVEFLANFLATNRPSSGKFCVALVEIDQITKIHNTHGRALCDRIISAVDQTFSSSIPDLVTSLDGLQQQLLCLLPDATVQEFTGQVEQVRLRIDATDFSHNRGAIKISISCGITQDDCRSTPDQLLTHLRELLRQAQRYGRNCSFVQDGAQSAPASSPQVEVETRRIEV
jgi:diguanylate cyclase